MILTSSAVKISFLSVCIVLPGVLFGSAWSTKAPTPTSRSFHFAESVGAMIFAGQGAGPTQGRFDRYDPITNTWTELPSPSELYQRASVVLGMKIYAFGGVAHGGPLNDVSVFDPGTNTWTGGAAMPTTRSAPAGATVAGRAYVLGGSSYFGDLTGTTANEAFEPAMNSWQVRRPMPRPRIALAAEAVGTKIYVFGGHSAGTVLDIVDVYDASSDMWTTLARRMPRPRTNGATAVISGKVLLFGGNDQSGAAISAVDEFDPVSGSWTCREVMPTARLGLAVASVNGIAYVIAGESQGNMLSMVEAYDRSKDTSRVCNTFLVAFTGFDNAPQASSCTTPPLNRGSGVEYPLTHLVDGQGMTTLLQNIAGFSELSFIRAHAFTFYSGQNGNACTPPSNRKDHTEAAAWLQNQSFGSGDRLIIVGHSYGGFRAWLFAEQVAQMPTHGSVEALILVDPIDWEICSDLVGYMQPQGPCQQEKIKLGVPTGVPSDRVFVYRQNKESSRLRGFTIVGTDPWRDVVLWIEHSDIDDWSSVQRGVLNLLKPGLIVGPGVRLTTWPVVVDGRGPRGEMTFNVVIKNSGTIYATNIKASRARLYRLDNPSGPAVATSINNPGYINQPVGPRQSVVISYVFPFWAGRSREAMRLEADIQFNGDPPISARFQVEVP